MTDVPPGWLLLQDPAVEPRPGALERLAAVATDPPEGLPAPAVVAAKVVDADGRLHPASEPWPDIFEKEVSTAAAAQRLVSLRATRPGLLLVRSDLTARYGDPREATDLLEWTARVLRGNEHAGYLVPQAEATRATAGDGGLRHHARMLLGDGWRAEEKLWLGLLVAQDALRRRSRRPSSDIRRTR